MAPPLAFMARTAARHPRKVPSRLMPMVSAPRFQGRMLDRRFSQYTGAVNQDVQPSIGLYTIGHDDIPPGFVGDIVVHEATLSAHRVGCRVTGFPVAVGDRDPSALGDEALGAGESDTRSTTRDQRGFPIDTSVSIVHSQYLFSWSLVAGRPVTLRFGEPRIC